MGSQARNQRGTTGRLPFIF